MDTDEHVMNQAMWTVRDSDGIDHRAIQQSAGIFTWVITACPWWQTHNVSGEKAPVRTDVQPTCVECTRIELDALGTPKCKHCGQGAAMHNIHMHTFEAT